MTPTKWGEKCQLVHPMRDRWKKDWLHSLTHSLLELYKRRAKLHVNTIANGYWMCEYGMHILHKLVVMLRTVVEMSWDSPAGNVFSALQLYSPSSRPVSCEMLSMLTTFPALSSVVEFSIVTLGEAGMIWLYLSQDIVGMGRPTAVHCKISVSENSLEMLAGKFVAVAPSRIVNSTTVIVRVLCDKVLFIHIHCTHESRYGCLGLESILLHRSRSTCIFHSGSAD